MISYNSAVFLSSLLLLGLLQYWVRRGSSHQKRLVFKVVGLTTVIALLLPGLLSTFTVLQTGLLMALMAALAGALIPVAELLPVKTTEFESEGVMEKDSVIPEDEKSVDIKEHKANEEAYEGEKSVVMNQETSEEEAMVAVVSETREESMVEQKPEPDESPGETVLDDDDDVTEANEEVLCEEIESDEAFGAEDVIEEIKSKELVTEEIISEELVTEEVVSEELVTEEVVSEEKESVEISGEMVLPDIFSETMAEILLMNGYLALKEEAEEEAIDSFKMVCQRAQVTDQRMMAYMELKLLLPETGRVMELIHLCDELLEGDVELTAVQVNYIQNHSHYLKRLVSLLNAHGVSLGQPYSAMPDELKEMAMTYQK